MSEETTNNYDNRKGTFVSLGLGDVAFFMFLIFALHTCQVSDCTSDPKVSDVNQSYIDTLPWMQK